ncbi:hypothetical protein CRP01_02915 [Flavilitoribacter nigricans DSM 23189 = NBRC 102662]|uniref:Uncharacterized protein n=1 Tax=Flavilitoribacter nigricans (strain ATCC 23147 / DSM 23189 / NBRC 102662 / NCIMB 1420 / SS-2) TaxID=1122177 RepID=A0A2D0NJB4_FLAN2|nr:hypothetical protein CRP01_02915 [Flavilitoribacter nigricans DSM 23189 = NBRC 102662]
MFAGKRQNKRAIYPRGFRRQTDTLGKRPSALEFFVSFGLTVDYLIFNSDWKSSGIAAVTTGSGQNPASCSRK